MAAPFVRYGLRTADPGAAVAFCRAPARWTASDFTRAPGHCYPIDQGASLALVSTAR